MIEVIRNQGVNAPGKRHVTVIIHRTHYSLEGTSFPHQSPGGCGHAGAGERDLAILGLLLMLSPSGGVTGYSVCVSCTVPLNPSPSGRHSQKSMPMFSLCVCVCAVCVCVCVCVSVCVCLIGTDRQTCRSGKKIHERVIRHLRYIYYVELI